MLRMQVAVVLPRVLQSCTYSPGPLGAGSFLSPIRGTTDLVTSSGHDDVA